MHRIKRARPAAKSKWQKWISPSPARPFSALRRTVLSGPRRRRTPESSLLGAWSPFEDGTRGWRSWPRWRPRQSLPRTAHPLSNTELDVKGEFSWQAYVLLWYTLLHHHHHRQGSFPMNRFNPHTEMLCDGYTVKKILNCHIYPLPGVHAKNLKKMACPNLCRSRR